MLRLLFSFALLSSVFAVAADAPPRLHMVGDSTMANKPLDLPERGWGMVLGQFFTDPAMVRNYALNGRSTKSFIDEGHWAKALDEMHAGDFLIVQFGHNDEKVQDPKRGTDPATTFRDNLRRYLREARAKGATPILATPVARRKFDAAGKLVATHGEYPAAVRAVAAEEKVPLLELETATSQWLQAEGDEPTKKYFMWIEAGKYAKIPDGRKDDTHFVEAGATKVAALAVAQMRELKLPVVKWLK